MRQGSGERSGPGAAGPGLGCAVLPLARARRFPCAQPAEGCRLLSPPRHVPQCRSRARRCPARWGPAARPLSLECPGAPTPLTRIARGDAGERAVRADRRPGRWRSTHGFASSSRCRRSRTHGCSRHSYAHHKHRPRTRAHALVSALGRGFRAVFASAIALTERRWRGAPQRHARGGAGRGGASACHGCDV